jgi:hypothetical protein
MIQQEYQGHEVLAKSRIGKCKAEMENRQKKNPKDGQHLFLLFPYNLEVVIIRILQKLSRPFGQHLLEIQRTQEFEHLLHQ